MRVAIVLSLLLFVAAIPPLKEEEGDKRGVEVVSADSLSRLIQEKPKLLLFFGSTSCPNCL
jgi:thiol-disulfide isomerase/thioredoxin